MEQKYNIKAALEALLFLAPEPVKEKELEEALEISSTKLQETLKSLSREYNEDPNRGLKIENIAGGLIVSTKEDYAEPIKKLYQPKVQHRITQASLETLAIIAYRQPITRAKIEEIRGVKAEKALFTLMKKGLIQEVGRLEQTGTPILYGTTDLFLEHFGLSDISQLPDPEGLMEED